VIGVSDLRKVCGTSNEQCYEIYVRVVFCSTVLIRKATTEGKRKGNRGMLLLAETTEFEKFTNVSEGDVFGSGGDRSETAPSPHGFQHGWAIDCGEGRGGSAGADGI